MQLYLLKLVDKNDKINQRAMHSSLKGGALLKPSVHEANESVMPWTPFEKVRVDDDGATWLFVVM